MTLTYSKNYSLFSLLNMNATSGVAALFTDLRFKFTHPSRNYMTDGSPAPRWDMRMLLQAWGRFVEL